MDTAEIVILISACSVVVTAIGAGAALWARVDSKKSAEAAKYSNTIAEGAQAEAKRSADAAERSADAAEQSTQTASRTADMQEAEFRERNIPKAIAKVYDIDFPSKNVSNNATSGPFHNPAQPAVYVSKGIYGMRVRAIPQSIDFKISAISYRLVCNGKLFEHRSNFTPPQIASISEKIYPSASLYFPKSLVCCFDQPYSITIAIYTTSDIAPVILSDVDIDNIDILTKRFRSFFEDCKSSSIELNDWYERQHGEPVWQDHS